MISVAFLHYHLNPSGVTRVIRSQIESITTHTPDIPIKVLTSALPSGKEFKDILLFTDATMEYLCPDITRQDALICKESLYRFIKRIVSPETVLHSHNSSLGKNPILTYVLYQLAKEGYPTVIQCNDFAEDRPANMEFSRRIIEDYFASDVFLILYPKFRNCHFITINSHDYNRLIAKNISKDQVHYIPNPVGFEVIKDSDTSKYRNNKSNLCEQLQISNTLPLYVYPVRPIQRKNIGEFILCATLFMDKANWAITLGIENPAEISAYEQWKAFTRTYNIPVYFEASKKCDFPSIMNAADRIITTSRQEGFGMTFLEPWLLKKPVCGRNLPNVTRDFLTNGIRFTHLYSTLTVETESGLSDFADLSQASQMNYIIKLLKDTSKKNQCIKNNKLDFILFDTIPGHLIKENKRIIEEVYSIKKYGDALLKIYKKLV